MTGPRARPRGRSSSSPAPLPPDSGLVRSERIRNIPRSLDLSPLAHRFMRSDKPIGVVRVRKLMDGTIAPVTLNAPVALNALSARPTREAAEAAVRTLLLWAGDDPDREGLKSTPERAGRSYEEFFAGSRTH